MRAILFAAIVAACIAAGFAQDQPMHPCKSQEDGLCATRPKITRHVEPQFSEYGRKHKISGTVLLTFTVLPDGTTSDITINRSLEKSLDQNAIEAVRQWRFEPGTYKGLPVAVSIQAELSFKIY